MHVDGHGQAKVSQLENSLLGNKNVGSFHIPADVENGAEKLFSQGDLIPVHNLIAVDEEQAITLLISRLNFTLMLLSRPAKSCSQNSNTR